MYTLKIEFNYCLLCAHVSQALPGLHLSSAAGAKRIETYLHITKATHTLCVTLCCSHVTLLLCSKVC